MKLSVVIPMYNEEDTVLICADKLTNALSERFAPSDFEIIFVDDGSTDSSVSILDGIMQKNSSVRYVSYAPNRGKGHAVRTGVLASVGDCVVYTDCDLAYGAEIVLEMYDALTGDVCIGSRRIHPEGYADYTKTRKLMSDAYVWVLQKYAGFKHSDSQCGIKCFKGDAARWLFSKCEMDGFSFDLEVLMLADRYGYVVTEHPVKVIHNRERASKVRPVRDTFKMLSDVRKIKRKLKDLNIYESREKIV